MISAGQIAEVLRNNGKEESISEVKIDPKGRVISRLKNRLDSRRPYRLAVYPVQEEPELRILVFPVLKFPQDNNLLRRLGVMNLGFGCGCLASTLTKHMLIFKIEHFCENDDGPSPEFLERLLNHCVKCIRCIEQTLLFEFIAETGVSREKLCSSSIASSETADSVIGVN